MSERPPEISIVVPCYNERNAVAEVLDALDAVLREAGMNYEIIAVDDGSTDGTGDAIDGERYRLVRHPVNRGYGAALKTGVRAARADWVAITDADGTYPNERLPELIARSADADMVVGARTGGHVRVPYVRRPAKWLLAKLANYLSGRRIPDLNSGLRVIRKSMWQRYERYFPDGFSLTTTITLAALTNNYRVEYVPIDYHRRVGKSKIRPVRDTLNFVRLIVRTILYFDPLKVFLPAGLVLFLLSGVVGVTTLVLSMVFGIGRFLDATTLILFVSALQMIAIGMLADLITKRLE